MNQRFILILISWLIGFHAFGQVDIGKIFIESINTPEDFVKNENHKIIFNSGDPIRGEKIIRSLHERYAPMDFHHTDMLEYNMGTSKSYVMHIYAKKKGEIMYADFQMRLDPDSKKINEMAFVAEVSEPISLPNGDITENYTLDWLEQYIQKLNTEYNLYGSVHITKGDNVLLESYFGFEDAHQKIPISSKTKFNIASGGKMFTAIAIMQLVEQNKLKLSDPITKYIKGFSDAHKAEKITIHHLLSHTSGIEDYWQGQRIEELETAKSNDDHLNVVLKKGFIFEAGKDYQYCNSNFILAGAIVERVSKMDFYEYINKNILEKSDMRNSGYHSFRDVGIAHFLVRSEDKNQWKEHQGGPRGSAAGGAVSNGLDFIKFSKALKDNILISKTSLDILTTIHNQPFHEPEGYGYGFIPQEYEGILSYGHGGTSKGVNFEFRYFPTLDITFVIFSNQDNGAFDDLKRNTIKLITGTR